MKKITRVAVLLAGILMLITGCGSSKNGLEKMKKANDGEKLLEKYDSILYTMTDGNESQKQNCLLADTASGPVISYQWDDGDVVYSEGNYYSKSGLMSTSYAVGWFMPDYYDELLEKNIKIFLVDDIEGEELLSEEKNDDGILITTEYQKDGKTLHYKYQVDEKTYEIKDFKSYTVEGDKETLYAIGKVKFGVKYEEPAFVKRIQTTKRLRNLTVIVDPDTKTEKTYTSIISSFASVKGFVRDGYTLYKDKDAKNKYSYEKADENESYADLTLYCIKK